MAMSVRIPFVYIVSVLGTITFLSAVWTALFYFLLGMPRKAYPLDQSAGYEKIAGCKRLGRG